MAQATEDCTKPPDGSTFLEFCERCCENCRIVRWLGEENPPEGEIDGTYEERDPSKEPQWSLDCPLCEQLFFMVPSSEYELEGVGLKLGRLDIATVERNCRWPRSNDWRPYDILQVNHGMGRNDTKRLGTMTFVLTHMPGERQYEVKAESIKPVGINWEAVREWTRHCTTNHKSCAGPSEVLHIPGLKMIDCKTGKVGHFSENRAPYVALSYVWGESQDASVDYPQAILDSTEAVLALGLRYLWVDRICIDQEDNIHKLAQIGMMDQIYSRAHLTIVSCSDDAEQGLPGVGKSARHIYSPLWLGDRKVEYRFTPALSVASSRWIERGWTYQEGFFSRRKLFFTDAGVALWCKSMYYEESVSRSLKDTDEVRTDLFPLVPNKAMPVELIEGSQRILWKIVQQYTEREITFESDALNACLGILNHLGHKHLWGVPIHDEILTLGLGWDIQDGGLERRVERTAFPSWSWTRWKATVSLNWQQKHPSSIVSIKTHLPSGEEFDIIHDSRYNGNLGAICSGTMLSITGTFLTPRLLVVETEYHVRCYSIFSSACDADIKILIKLDNGDEALEIADADDIDFLEVEPLYKNTHGKFTGQFLLVRRLVDTYRRIGVAYLDINNYYEDTCAESERFEVGIVPMKRRRNRTIDLI